MVEIIYFDNVSKSGKYDKVSPEHFTTSLTKRGVNTVRLMNFIRSMDYTGNDTVTLSSSPRFC